MTQLGRLPCSLLRRRLPCIWRSGSSSRCCRPRLLTSCAPRSYATTASSYSSSSSWIRPAVQQTSAPLRLDPPFTPIPGETHCATANNKAHAVLYLCQGCHTPLFASTDYAPGSALGQHRNGWPRFTQPIAPRSVVVRGVRQRLTTNTGTTTRRTPSNAPTSGVLQPPPQPRTMQLPHAEVQMAYSGLPVEGDLVHTGGPRGMSPVQRPTWRERCLRDANKRSDPSLLEGVCAQCGVAVCRLSMTRREGLCYVTTASAVEAVLAKGEEGQQSK